MIRKFLIAGVILAVLSTLALTYRHRIALSFATSGEPIPQVEGAAAVPGGTSYGDDDHFSVVQLDAQTFAIAEPYSWARNVNYLILGEQRALLFDAGVGHYDIRPIVRLLTELPLTFMPSHFHYDHTGQGTWERIAIVDLPHVRAQADGDRLALNWGQHLGPSEGIELPVWEVTEWVAPNARIDLGGRSLVLLYTPGHTDNSVSLLDTERELMFTGDFLTSSGSMSSFLPTARLGDYLQSAEKVLRKTASMQNAVFRGAHAPPANTIPENSTADLAALRDQLRAIRESDLASSGSYPVVYRIKEGMDLQAEPAFLQNWTPTYPDGHAVH